jgi:maleate isomerase
VSGITRKIGLMVPSSNTTVEQDFQAVAQPGLSLHAARMWLTGSDADVLERMNADIDLCARHLASAGLDLIVYACTGGSLMEGPGHDRRVAARISGIADGTPTITTSTAVLQALQALGLHRLSVVTPYPPAMTALVAKFLTGNGFEVCGIAGRGHGSNLEIGADPLDDITTFATANTDDAADGIFLSCTNWRAMSVAARLEAETGRPVVTSNQATIWATYRAAGITAAIPGYGQLLAAT